MTMSGNLAPLALDVWVVRTSDMIASELDGEVVGLSMRTGFFYGFNRIGSRVWHMLQQPLRIGDACAALEQEFDVSPATCRTQILALLEKLRAEGLIASIGEPPPDAA
jgi:hypothetical protein